MIVFTPGRMIFVLVVALQMSAFGGKADIRRT
jgi:hypothetical protein